MPCELYVAELALTEERDLARFALVAQHNHLRTRYRHIGQAQDFDRNRRSGLLNGVTVLIMHRPHTPENRPGEDDLPTF